MPHHIDCECDNIGTQPGYVAPDNQSGSLCTRSDISFWRCWFWQRKVLAVWCIWLRHVSKKIQNF